MTTSPDLRWSPNDAGVCVLGRRTSKWPHKTRSVKAGCVRPPLRPGLHSPKSMFGPIAVGLRQETQQTLMDCTICHDSHQEMSCHLRQSIDSRIDSGSRAWGRGCASRPERRCDW